MKNLKWLCNCNLPTTALQNQLDKSENSGDQIQFGNLNTEKNEPTDFSAHP